MRADRRHAEQFGRRGEQFAAFWLMVCGWRILARRVRVGVGEVDLIARRGRTLAFIEVKTRRRARDLDDAIDARRLQRVAAAAATIAHRYQRPSDTLRIDVILLAPGAWPRQIVNAWQP